MMKKGKIVVFGSYVTDLMFRVPRLPVKGETLKASTFKLGPGGKGSNQAIAAKRAGAEVAMITKIGKVLTKKGQYHLWQYFSEDYKNRIG